MATLEDLSRHIEVAEDLQSVVRTMKTISAVAIRRHELAEQAMAVRAEADDYLRQLTELRSKLPLRIYGKAKAHKVDPTLHRIVYAHLQAYEQRRAAGRL